MTARVQKIKSSFRDPDSQVFISDNKIIRLIRPPAVPGYHKLMASGLYDKLVDAHLLVPHQDATGDFSDMVETAGDVMIAPQRVPFISYPFEWSFSGLKAAALNTLRIQKLCLDHGMTLQDATAFNIQYLDGHWMMIDTGSFREQTEFVAWGAYRQFCQHFLAPLLLMAYGDARLLSLFSHYLDGIPLDLAARLLPLRARLRPAVMMHVVMHSRYTLRDFDVSDVKTQARTVSKASAYGLIDQLEGLIKSLDVEKRETVWTAYEATHTYDTQEFKDKEDFILKSIDTLKPLSVWDLGANTGHFSRLIADAAPPGCSIVAFEYDFMTVEAGYRQSCSHKKNRPLHLWMDLLNPTAGSGWAGQEWQSLIERGPADIVLALALVHHLCLAGNIGFDQLAEFMNKSARHLIIEFVPKDDPQSQRLLKSRCHAYPLYTQDNFETAMGKYFTVIEKKKISQTGRTVYLMQRQHDD